MKNFWLPHSGESMSPLLRSGDEVLISPVSPGDAKVGDILLIIPPEGGEMILHRLIGEPFLTKGDRTLTSETLNASGLVGRAIARRRGNFEIRLDDDLKNFQGLFVLLSRQRLRGKWIRKAAFVFLSLMVLVFELCNEKTTGRRTGEHPGVDP